MCLHLHLKAFPQHYLSLDSIDKRILNKVVPPLLSLFYKKVIPLFPQVCLFGPAEIFQYYVQPSVFETCVNFYLTMQA